MELLTSSYVCVCGVLLCEYGVLSKGKAICTVTAAVSRSASLCALCFIDFRTPGIKTVPKTKHHVTVTHSQALGRPCYEVLPWIAFAYY